MITIGLDARSALKERRGIGTYTIELIKNLAEIDNENKYILYVDRNDENKVLPQKKNFLIKRLIPANYILWEQFPLPLNVFKDKIDILHCTAMTAPLFLDENVNIIATIHDVTYLKDYSFLPASGIFYQKVGRLYRKYIVPKIIRKASKILTVSEFSKSDILSHFPEFEEREIIVTHEAKDKMFSLVDRAAAREKINQKFKIGDSYILLLGGIDPRKNTKLVIQKFIEMKREHMISEKLVIVGLPKWRNTSFYQMVSDSPYSKDIVFTDHIPDEDLVMLYNCATVFLYPSLFEGFGLPVLEAMACGTPVVASNASSIPEIAGDAALLVDPRRGDQLKEAIVDVLSNKALREQMVERGFEQVKKFSWRKMAHETLEAYISVGERS